MVTLFDTTAGVRVNKGLIEITLVKALKTADHLHQMYKIVDLHKNDMLTFTHGAKEITIIAERKHERTILKIFEKDQLVKRIDNLTSLSITLQEQAYETRGVLYLAMKALYDARVNIVEIVSTLTELTIIVMKEDAKRAKQALEEMILLTESTAAWSEERE